MNKQVGPKEVQFIKQAAQYLEQPSFIVRVTNALGKPLEAGMNLLPEKAQKSISAATKASLEKALAISIRTIPYSKGGTFSTGRENSFWTDWVHTIATSATGAAGGFFGLAALPVELPASTMIMLRSIASIADDYGHDLEDVKVRLECLMVFAMGSPAETDDEMESVYFTSRVAMARILDEAAKWLVKKSSEEVAKAISEKSAPIVIRFIASVAARFEVVVTEKVLAQAIPIIGAVSGAVINGAFTDHFNAVAKYHFGLRALENQYGAEVVKQIYLTSTKEMAQARKIRT